MWSTIRPNVAEPVGELAELAQLEYPNEDPEYVRAAIAAAERELRERTSHRRRRRWWRWFVRGHGALDPCGVSGT